MATVGSPREVPFLMRAAGWVAKKTARSRPQLLLLLQSVMLNL
jgi:hypothetical protein